MAELTPDRDGFIVTFTVDEGERYKFGKVDVDIKLKDLPQDAVLPLLTVQSGRLVRRRGGRAFDLRC